MKVIDIQPEDVRAGDLADHISRTLDPREVGDRYRNAIWLIFAGGMLYGPFDMDNYTYKRVVPD